MARIIRDVEDAFELVLSFKAFLIGKPVESVIDGQKNDMLSTTGSS